jgi:hypothetical protein
MDNKIEDNMTTVQTNMCNIIEAMKDLLLYKNKHYGNSALEPIGIFYKGSAEDSIKIRLDDKLKRIFNSKEEPKTNDICDIIGYSFLYLTKRAENENIIAEIEKQKD